MRLKNKGILNAKFYLVLGRLYQVQIEIPEILPFFILDLSKCIVSTFSRFVSR